MKSINDLNIKYFSLFFMSILIFIYTTGQLTDVYIRHDDWEFMTYLLPNMPNHGTPWDKTYWEGRWLNYIWSFIARDLSVNANYILFITGYSLFSWLSATILIGKNSAILRLLCAYTIFFCPAYADLSLWPATLTPSVWISFLLLFVYYFYRKLVLVFLLFILLPASYAPLSAVCFLLMASTANTYKHTIKLGLIYYSSYVLGVIFIYSLNYIFHNHFGVSIAEWRNPNPIHSFDDLINNITKLVVFWRDYISKNSIIFSIGSILFIFTFFLFNKKNIFLKLVLPMAIVFLFDSMLYIYTGVDIPDRSFMWPWFIFCILISFWLPKPQLTRFLPIIFAILLIKTGSGVWYGFYTYESKHARFENNLATILKSQSRTDIFICGDVSKIIGSGNRSLVPLTLALWKKEGLNLKEGSPDECINIPNKVGLYNINNKTFYNLF